MEYPAMDLGTVRKRQTGESGHHQRFPPPSPSSPINIVHQVRAGEGVIYNLCSGNTANLDKHVCELPDFPPASVSL